MSRSFKEESKLEWNNGASPSTTEQKKFGALQRIADAAEKMSANITALINDRDKYKSHYEITEKENGRLHRQNARYKAEIKRLKARIN